MPQFERHRLPSQVVWCFFFQEEAYSLESSKELLEKDVVQLHAPRWQSMRKVSAQKLCSFNFNWGVDIKDVSDSSEDGVELNIFFRYRMF